MNRRPIITYAGDPALFTGLQSGLVTALPQESMEWRRSYGRPTRSVNVEVDFVPFSDECLSKDIPRSILGHPIFHTYWTDCADVDTYKSSVKEKIQTWVTTLKHHCITDWMVVLIETPDTKKSNKLLPRTTVLDKMKNDLGNKQGERCVSLIDPLKSDTRAVESWQMLLIKMRHLIMVAYNRALNKFEDNMRAERERRTEKSWSFCNYFLFQEELAQVFILLALYDEALVQYDELDALFTQFVLNYAVGDTPSWLNSFSTPCEKWEGLYLTKQHNPSMQEKIRSKDISLLEFRNYLFQRQCALLLQLNKPWELAARALTFLQNVLSELKILEVNIADGGAACWGFLSCMEVIRILGEYKDSSTTDAHALHTAPLWAYARDKLQVLGHLCGLMPGHENSSSELHVVVSLVCGMGPDPHTEEELQDNEKGLTPMTQLKEALSSPEAFKNHFLEFSEVSISTYKHIGRIRSARLIGRDLASFYMKIGEPQKACSFLSDQLKMYMEEDWPLLTAHTQLELAKCYLAIGDTERYIKSCAQIAASSILPDEKRHEAFKHMMDAVEENDKGPKLLISSDRIFEVTELKVISEGEVILDSKVQVQLVLNSKLPAGISCGKIEVMLKHIPETVEKPAHPRAGHKTSVEADRKSSSCSNSSQPQRTQPARRSNSNVSDSDTSHTQRDDDDWEDLVGRSSGGNQALHMTLGLEYKQDKSLSTASVLCNNPHKVLRRRDSQGALHCTDRSVVKEVLDDYLLAQSITIRPGCNNITLSTKVTKRGSYIAGQVVLGMEKVDFICGRGSVQCRPLSLEVVSESPRVFLARKNRDLVAGLLQTMILTIHSGSSTISQGTIINLKTSRGLLAKLEENKDDQLQREFEIPLPEILPFNNTSVSLTVLAELGPQRDPATIEHIVSLTSSLLDQRLDIEVHFIPPFLTSHKIHTANTRKFIQVSVVGLVPSTIQLFEPRLKLPDSETADVDLNMLNPSDQQLIVCTDQSASYMWEMINNLTDNQTAPIKTEFTLVYRPYDLFTKTLSEEPRNYRCTFDLQDYRTLYTIKSKVEPNKGSEFIRAGNMCHFHTILYHVAGTSTDDKTEKSSTMTQSSSNSIMYEVLADQNMWAVCGRTSGVLALERGTKQSVTLDVMPLTGGFLPLPSVRLSKYIPADAKQAPRDGSRKGDLVGTASSVPRLEPFNTGEVYNFSKALQVHVLPAVHPDKSDLT